MSDTPIYDRLLAEQHPLVVVRVPEGAAERFRRQMMEVSRAFSGTARPADHRFRMESVSVVDHPLHPSWTVGEVGGDRHPDAPDWP